MRIAIGLFFSCRLFFVPFCPSCGLPDLSCWQDQLTPHLRQYIISPFAESVQKQLLGHKKIERGIENWEMTLVDSA